MKEYIERDMAVSTCRTHNFADRDDRWAVSCLLKAIPAADVVERKRGEWEYLTQGFSDGMVMDDFGCSECDHVQTIPMNGWLPNFCPNCGADMRGVDHA
jgi:hypothetical protein